MVGLSCLDSQIPSANCHPQYPTTERATKLKLRPLSPIADLPCPATRAVPTRRRPSAASASSPAAPLPLLAGSGSLSETKERVQCRVEMASQLPRVCVTGGGGFIASWLVKLLLSRGYAVHATLRDPCDPKNAHLKQLDGAPENLHLFKADVLDCETLAPAVQGCQGVFHLATPVPEDKILHPDREVLDPAVKGTVNVLKVCSTLKVHKVVVMSSIAAVTSNPNWPQDRLKDESCWSDKEFCKEREDWYCLAKTLAEQEALEYARNNGLNVVTLCPPFVFGPLLQSSVNASSKLLLYVIKGGPDVMTNRMWEIVDVRDVADALLLLYENDQSSGRYICSPNRVCTRDLVDLLKKMYPEYGYVNNVVDADHAGSPLSSQKLRGLGWEPRKLESTLSDSVQSYEKAGLLQDVPDNPCRLPFLIRAWL